MSLKTRRFLLIFLSIALAEIALHSLFLTKHYTSDCYQFLFSQKALAQEYSNSGRPLTALMVFVIQNLGINLVDDQVPFTFAALLIIGYSIYSISYTAFHVSSENKLSWFQAILIIISSALVFNNIFTIELFTFSSATFFHSLSIFFISASLINVIGDITPRKYLLLLSFTILITFNYQGFGGIFVPLQIAFHLSSRKNYPFKRTVFDITKILSACFIALLLSMLYAKHIHPFIYNAPSFRIQGLNLSSIMNNIQFNISQEQLGATWISSYTIMPKYSLLFYLVSACTAFLLLGKKTNNDWKSTSYVLFAIISSCLFITYLPLLLTNGIWPASRTTLGIGALPAILFLVCVMSYKLGERFNIQISPFEAGVNGKSLEFNMNPTRALLTAIILSLVVVTAIYTLRLSWEHLETNRQDRNYAKQLYRVVKQEETKTGIKVDKISWTYDASRQWCYPNTLCYGSINISSRNEGWGFPNLLRKYWGRDLKIVEMPENVRAEYFAGKNWDVFNSEQVAVKGDTVYIAVY